MSCGKAPEGAIGVRVGYSLQNPAPGCVRFVITPKAGQGTDDPIDLQGRTSGTLRVGIGRGPGWSDELELYATLHRVDCSGPSIAEARRSTSFPPSGLRTETMVLAESDGGGAGGGGAGGGAAGGGTAGGGEVGGGGALGGGTAGGGEVGGGGGVGGGDVDGGPPHTLPDGGFVSDCDGGFEDVSNLAQPPRLWLDVGVFDRGSWLVGDVGSSGIRLETSGPWVRPQSSCTGTVAAVWARPTDGAAYTAANGELHLSTLDGGCQSVSSLSGPSGSTVVGLGGSSFNGVDTVLGVFDNGAAFVYGPTGLQTSKTGAALLYDLDATLYDAMVVAVGVTGNRASILRLDVATNTWSPMAMLSMPASGTELRAVSMVSTTSGFAAGKGTAYEWNGTLWLPMMPPPTGDVRGLKAFAADDVYAVGDDPRVWHWNGQAWRPASPALSLQPLNRIRGDSVCQLIVPGSNAVFRNH